MTDSHRDFSCSSLSSSINIIPSQKNDTESSLDSYQNIFDKDRNNFSTSTAISTIILDEEPLDKNLNRTFTKEISRTIINVFTGKPISPNPWRKLCSKNVQHQIEPEFFVPAHILTPNSTVKQSIINNQQSMNKTDHNADEPAFEQVLLEHKNSVEVQQKQQQQSTPLQRRRKKRNSLKDFDDNSSVSSDEGIVAQRPSDLHPKMNRIIDNEPSWHRLADVYTSEESDENNHSIRSNISYSLRLKSNTDGSDQSLNSTSSSTKTSFNFLESLSEDIPIENKHPDAKPYFFPPGFKQKEIREELANKLLAIFNQDVFSSQLSDKVTVVWSGRLTATAGHCTTRKNTGTAVITLSQKVCDSPGRCRDTLLHEMCHAAVTLIDGVMEQGHGPLWRQWTRAAELAYPHLPLISVRHTYDVTYKFIYRCVQCEYEVYRHSKSLNPSVDFCGKCMGTFDLIINNNNDDVNRGRQTPKKGINKYNLYVKENFQTIKQANPHFSTPQVMKQLSQNYKQKNQQQHIDLPELDKLTI